MNETRLSSSSSLNFDPDKIDEANQYLYFEVYRDFSSIGINLTLSRVLSLRVLVISVPLLCQVKITL